MPFCTKCGNQVGTEDVFCGKCGARQREGTAPRSAARNPDFLANMTPRTASLLCYIPVVGWIPCIIALAVPRFQHDRTVRFHAFQGLYLFVVWLIVDWVISPFIAIVPSPLGGAEFRMVKSILHLAVLCAWIFMLIKTSHEEAYHLPIVGELAERSVSEQR